MTKAPTKARKVAAPKQSRTTRAEDTPEAQTTPEKAKEAAEDQFAKADAAAADGSDETKLRMAALGGL